MERETNNNTTHKFNIGDVVRVGISNDYLMHHRNFLPPGTMGIVAEQRVSDASNCAGERVNFYRIVIPDINLVSNSGSNVQYFVTEDFLDLVKDRKWEYGWKWKEISRSEIE